MNQGKRKSGKFGSDNIHYLIIGRINLNKFRLIFSATKEKTNVNNR